MKKTEARNQKTKNIDRMATVDMVRVMQDENLNAARAIETELNAIATAIDKISERMKQGGRLFYIGCGTSGRLGVLDASECPPTYGVSKNTVIGIMAGGDGALRNAVEFVEDDKQAGIKAIKEYNLSHLDSVVGISVAGGANFVVGALEYAKDNGALTIALSSNEGCVIEQIADIGIHPDTGAEVVTGSTRMKAGSAHKMIINMISTGVMIKQGYVYENLMINLRPSNVKLRDRMIRIVSDITGTDYDSAQRLLEENDFSINKVIKLFDK